MKIEPEKSSSPPFAIAYVGPIFPLASQTFVYREVRELRKRGWTVQTVALYPPGKGGEIGDDLSKDRIVVYHWWICLTLLCAILELLRRPVSAINTFSIAVRDAISPGEPTRLIVRLKLLAQVVAGLGLARRLRARKIKHIHCHFSNAPTSVGMYAAMQMRVPFSFTGHANDLFHHRGLLKRKLERAKFVACISHWHKDWYSAIAPDDGNKYEVIRCGVDVEAWKPAATKTPGKQFQILTICRLVEKKGVDILIRAADSLGRQKIAADLTIAGDGPDEMKLHALSKMWSAGDSVTWLGAVANADVPGLMAQADVVAIACRADANGDRDGIPVVLMEAMACGVPVVSGDLPAIRELIEDGVSGFLVPGGDSEALAGRLKELAIDPDLRRRLAAEGRKKVVEEFSLEPNVDRLVAKITGKVPSPARKKRELAVSA